MCGILAHINCSSPFSLQKIEAILAKRGTDFFSTAKTERATFYHALLALTDNIENSIQPLQNEQDIVLLNGEIYNHLEIRTSLLNQSFFKTQTDTETLLEGFQQLQSKLFQYLRGMFSLLIYDKTNQHTYIYRDFFGIKPLYYSHHKKELTVCSSLDYFKKRQTDEEQINLTKKRGWPLQNNTLFKNVQQFPKGELGIFDNKKGVLSFVKIKPKDYSTKETLFDSIKASVKEQAASPYKTGILFSGGIDSTLIALAAKQLHLKLPLYTFDFKGNQEKFGYSEDLLFAKQIAEKLNLELRIVSYKDSDFTDYLKTHRTFSEPYLDLAGFSLHLLCKQAKKDGVKILLNGTGADEFFGGYRRHQLAKCFNFIPKLLHGKALQLLITKKFTSAQAIEKVTLKKYSGDSFTQTVLRYDQNEYLENNNLKYTDGIGLFHGIEIRVPLLTHQIVKHGLNELNKNQLGKTILKEILYKYLPKSLIDRPKSGFALPIQVFGKQKKKLRTQLLTDWLNHQI